MMKKYLHLLVILLCITIAFTAGCAGGQDTGAAPPPDRESKIPADAVKVTPQTDQHPPKSYSPDYSDPVPVAGGVNTAGAEDSAFVMPDGNTLYFFFTPDVRVPVEKQVIDGVTGIYVSKKAVGVWQEPQRVVLQDAGKLALDGCGFVSGSTMWFCSAREGYTGLHWFTADYAGGAWTNWKNADFDPGYQVGELHIYGDELYFHSDRADGMGGRDIWVSKMTGGSWQEPENVAAVNTARDEGWPALSPDGNELWISRDYGLWRSKRADGGWTAPELVFSPLAGEASVEGDGNVYFTHHFFDGDTMIEADIYVAERTAG